MADGSTRDMGTTSLWHRIADRIRRDGPITFADYMETALYDPEGGYYTNPPVGERGDFVTSPHVSPAFGVLMARMIEDLWDRLRRPHGFRVIEAGAGDGTLAERILRSLPDEIGSTAPYMAVDRSAGARARLTDVRARFEGTRILRVLAELPTSEPSSPDSGGPEAGVLIANELLDNMPMRRFRGTVDGPVELRVGLQDDGFVLVETPIDPQNAPAVGHLSPGEETVVSPAATEFVERAAAAIGRGYIVLFDYAAAPSAGDAAVHGYRRHRVESDVLQDPGSRDITAGVDVPGLLDRASLLGLRTWGPLTQRNALLNLGFRRWERANRRQQTAASEEGDGRRAVRAYSARTRAGMLIAQEGLGGFAVVCLGVGDPPRPDLLLDGEREPPVDDTIELDLREGRPR